MAGIDNIIRSIMAEAEEAAAAVRSEAEGKAAEIRAEAASQADSFATASAIAEAVRSIGGVDLVLFGEGSGDIYAQQTGSMVGALLGWNCLNSVSALSADGDGLVDVQQLEQRFLRLQQPRRV